jgi:hypothetical protein
LLLFIKNTKKIVPTIVVISVGAIIDMKEGTIRYQFPLKKGMEHFRRKRKKLPFDSIIRTNYDLDASSLENT